MLTVIHSHICMNYSLNKVNRKIILSLGLYPVVLCFAAEVTVSFQMILFFLYQLCNVYDVDTAITTIYIKYNYPLLWKSENENKNGVTVWYARSNAICIFFKYQCTIII